MPAARSAHRKKPGAKNDAIALLKADHRRVRGPLSGPEQVTGKAPAREGLVGLVRT